MNKKDTSAEFAISRFLFEKSRMKLFDTGINEALKDKIAKEITLDIIDAVIDSKKNINMLFDKDLWNSFEGTSDDRFIYETFMKFWNEVKKQTKKL